MAKVVVDLTHRGSDQSKNNTCKLTFDMYYSYDIISSGRTQRYDLGCTRDQGGVDYKQLALYINGQQIPFDEKASRNVNDTKISSVPNTEKPTVLVSNFNGTEYAFRFRAVIRYPPLEMKEEKTGRVFKKTTTKKVPLEIPWKITWLDPWDDPKFISGKLSLDGSEFKTVSCCLWNLGKSVGLKFDQ